MKKDLSATIVTLVLTLITVISWAGFEIYRSLTIKPVPPVPAEIINPLDPTLDTKSLDEINQRIFMSDSEIGTALPSATPAPSPTISPVTTPTATPISSPIATATP